jgi:hypothetical protein
MSRISYPKIQVLNEVDVSNADAFNNLKGRPPSSVRF